jgi:hypothetical protein
VHDCGADFFAGAVESDRTLASFNQKTQCRQHIANTGSGGTEVKTSTGLSIKRQTPQVNLNVKFNENKAK